MLSRRTLFGHAMACAAVPTILTSLASRSAHAEEPTGQPQFGLNFYPSPQVTFSDAGIEFLFPLVGKPGVRPR
jgi:hypothetical protein